MVIASASTTPGWTYGGVDLDSLDRDVPLDRDDVRLGAPVLPAWVSGFRLPQWQAIVDTVHAFASGADVVFLDAPTGCLGADTMVGINRGGKGYQLPIADLVHRFNGGSIPLGRGQSRLTRWRPDIPTRVQYNLNGRVRLTEIKDAWCSGVKDVFRLETSGGKSIVATAMHPFLTADGWVELGGLKVGQTVLANVGQGMGERKAKPQYHITGNLVHHPFAGRRGVKPSGGGWSVPTHRLIAEARFNEMDVREFVGRVKAGRVEGLVFLDPQVYAVHHLDYDHRNNHPDNLMVLTHSDHHRLEAAEGKGGNVLYRVDEEKVESITHLGPQMTYDLEVADEPHNYLANGLVVHNTGKTLIGETVRRLLRASKTSYVCTTKSLQDQFCVAPETKILTADLAYVQAGEIKAGMTLVGFDEERSPSRRMFRPAEVEEVAKITRPSYRLQFDDGTVVVCSAEHRWLTGVGQTVKWMRTDEMRVGPNVGSKVVRILDVWETDHSRAAGYLAAAFDGEGHLHQSDPVRGRGADVNLSFAQNDNAMLAEVRDYLDQYGIAYRVHVGQDCRRLTISHRRDVLRILGQMRPARLLPKLDLNRMGMIGPARAARLVSREFIGDTTVVAIRTSTGTYIAEGLASHNCHDFGDYARVLKGRDNYPTHDHPELFNRPVWERVTAGDCLKQRTSLPACSGCDLMSLPGVPDLDDDGEDPLHCMHCHPVSACPYEGAKAAAMASPLSVLNTAYFLAEANNVGRFSKRDLVIADECDVLESSLLGYVTVTVGKRMRADLGITVPRLKTKEAAWAEWAVEEALPKISLRIARIGTNPSTSREAKELRRLTSAAQGLGKLVDDLSKPESEQNYVYTGYERQDKNDHDIVFKPVRVNDVAKPVLWRHAKRWLLMSATIIDPTEMVESLGLESFNYEVVSVPNGFPKENRPILVQPVGEMTKRATDEDPTIKPKMVAKLIGIIRKHPGERVLVHTVSYDLTQYLFDKVRMVCKDRPVLVYSDPREREEVLALYKKTPGAVLLAPSFDRGVDLPHDNCRVQVVVKMPFMSLGDKQVQRRLYSKGGDTWYKVAMVRSLVQMTGRGVRSADDWCVTYILDGTFAKQWSSIKRLLPSWWSESVDMTGGARTVLPPFESKENSQ